MGSQLPRGAVLPTLRSQLPTLKPGEQRVVEVVLAQPGWIIEATLQDVAEEAGVSTATVVRAAQHLGFRGFPHLRVLLARDLGVAQEVPQAGSGSPAGTVRRYFAHIAAGAESMASLLGAEDLDRAVRMLTEARRILVAGNGVSAPVAADFAMRLAALGRAAECPSDNLDQQIRAGLLRAGDLCVVVSGTGATRSTLAVARAARGAGADVLSLISFTGSPLSAYASVELVTGLGEGGSLREELQSTLRIPHLILANALVTAVADELPDAAEIRSRVLDAVATELESGPE